MRGDYKRKFDVKYRRNKSINTSEVWDIYVDDVKIGFIEKPMNNTRVFVTIQDNRILQHFADVKTAKMYIRDNIKEFIK